MLIPLLGLLALVGVGLAMGGKGGGGAGGAGAVDTTGIPPSLVAQINAALDSADPSVMKSVANMVRSAGFPVAATSLEQAATSVEAAMNAIPAVRAGVNPAPKADDQNARTLAGKLAQTLSGLSLAEARNSAAVKSLVLAFQGVERGRGFYIGNLDGLYGAKAALALAKDHGIVPPHPLWWPKKDPAMAKRAYKAGLAAYVAADPQRSEEWAQAMNVDND